MEFAKVFARLVGIQSLLVSQRTTVPLSERDRQFQVILHSGLPDDAYHRLFRLNLSLIPTGVLTWDSRSGGWRPKRSP